MRILGEIARILVGGLFIFSDIIKVNDPVGTAIKLEEYFEVFAYDFAPFFEWFVPAALFLSVFLSVLEVVLGIALLMGYRMRITAWVLLGLIIFFTFLTFYSAYFNKVTDCGCFGDAIKLTPWESFTKDIILTILIGLVFLQKEKIRPLANPMLGNIAVAGSTLVLTLLAVYAIQHLPFIDFRSYAVGNHLPTLMQPSEELRYAYIMEKDGETVSLENYPTGDEYTFKEMILVNPEAQPKITDLGIWTDEGEFTDQLMEGEKIIIILHDVDKASAKNIDLIQGLGKTGKTVWILTSSGYESFEKFRHEYQLAFPYFFADATVLKTMIRSNPGVMAMSQGMVLAKWHFNDAPSASEVKSVFADF